MKRAVILVAMLTALSWHVLQVANSSRAHAQVVENGKLVLWVDPRTGQVFIRPGHGRVRYVIPAAVSQSELEHQVDRKVEEKTQVFETQLQQQRSVNASLAQSNTDLTKQVAEIKPAWKDYTDTFFKKFSIGTLVYMDWAMYTHTAFGPQYLDSAMNPPGPGNNYYNSFDVTRAYINLLFTPTDDWLMRVTPDIYRTYGSANDKFGAQGGIGSTLDGNLSYRIKYAYLQYKKPFDLMPNLKGGTITMGFQPNPLIDWEENLYGYRFVNLVPWNYLSLSSTQAGLSAQIPFKEGERTYLESDFGVFTNASFRAFEQTNTKQAMVRVTAYPFGALWRYDGLGVTGFFNYGYGNTTPDQGDLPGPLKAGQSHITRVAALVHYAAENWGLAGEFDWGHNAFTASNLYSGSGPGDAFGFATNTATNPGYTDWNTMVTAFQNNGKSTQQGFDFFGHYHIPTTPFTLFGMFEQFLPNTQVQPNPLDFQRFIVGVAYQYNEYLRFAVDTQNLLFYHGEFPVTGTTIKNFNPGATFTKFFNGSLASPVPRDMHTFMANVEFNY